MKKIIKIILLILLIVSCNPESQSKQLIYKNIVIISDMSSRLDNKPSKDIDEIHKLIQYFKTECVKPGEKVGDKSSISFSLFSEKVLASIDVDKIKNLGEKQRFINSTGEYKSKGLLQEIDNFENMVKKTYANTRNQGLDLISILIDKIENQQITKEDTYLTDGIDTTFIKYENHIYIFTDGYLEYKNKERNSQFYFGSSEIDKIRQFCKVNKVDVAKALETNNSLCLPPTKNKKNQHIFLHVLETHERDKNEKSQSYKHTMALRDNEILRAVWQKWALESGFKEFEWKKY
ncbi:hypothetical protein CLV94_2036 [Flavobacterium endophyticum]|uniref:VWFA domain-containing protein n=1 Tax=Flavobacterium endophyticum TaxID=1540163 RepID=A0A495MDG4_9FLAO|nr:hypothetical protein [Flavobacterium endophyticum]RKS23132.1 hypothetical protein CLV94_2036 [Flavobacterium endophyticum]